MNLLKNISTGKKLASCFAVFLLIVTIILVFGYNNLNEPETVRNAFIFGWVLLILIAVILTVYLNKLISEPIKEMSHIAGEIAKGNLNIAITTTSRNDEVGSLASSFQQMIVSIREIADTADKITNGDTNIRISARSENDILGKSFEKMLVSFREISEAASRVVSGDLNVTVNDNLIGKHITDMINNFKNLLREMQDTVNILSTSANQIRLETSQLSSSVAETATAITETTTTIEEVKQTAKSSSEKARHVLESSQKTVKVSEKGKKSVEETISGMNQIREQMESVADSIIRLSEQTQAIGEIIMTIDNLAEQSNLLAVNAAIEAAKADEHGKGFTIVAQEVRKLAEQSKQATSQVRGILNNIQKATNNAVMATEQGNKTVEEGVKKSTQIREVIQVLADNIIETSQASTQIAAISQQQAIGMDQIATAMEDIKKASIINTNSTKEVNQAVESFHKAGTNLKEMISSYRV